MLLAGLLTASGCSSLHVQHHMYRGYLGDQITQAVCVLQSTGGSGVSGWVQFTQQEDGILITAEVDGLAPGKHGFHIHELGDLRQGDGSGCAGHYNPTKQRHGNPKWSVRHVGDLGNLEADANGHASYSRVDALLHLTGPFTISGRSIIVHADEDDFASQPTGNAGARVAQGTIGIAEIGTKFEK